MRQIVLHTLIISACLGSVACGPQHIRAFKQRERNYHEGEYAAARGESAPSSGSLYSEAVAGYLEDTRAVRIGDVVLVRIDEYADASGNASTKLSKDSSRSAEMQSLLGLVPAIKKAYPNIDPTKLMAMAASSDFTGKGDTTRSGQLSGTIAVKVRREMPNGDLFIEGTKVVMINHEEYHLYVSGLIRPSDIEGDNSIPSGRIADAQVEFTGRGDIDDQTERGWLTALLDSINPF